MKRLVAVIAVSIALLASGRPGVSAGAPADLDALLAPVALYPDQLLAQMLLCAANPGMIGALSEWLRSHDTLKGSELQNAAVASGFTDSFAAIVIFPDVVDYMASRMDWTTKLGQAFAADKSAVFDSVQRLRKKAQGTGALKSTPQQQVETKTTTSGQQVIVIEPSNPQVVYVPQYNPTVVYTQPSTVVVQQDNSADAAVAGLIGFTAGIAIGAAFDNNYYYGPYGWHGGAYMYNDAWDDYYDNREDAREDWQDHREDMYDERSDRAKNTQEQRTERQQNAQQNRTERSSTQSTTQQRADRQTQQTQQPQRTAAGTSQEARGYSGDASAAAARERSGTKSDAFSGYSSGKSERAASQRGQKSRGSSRSSGGSRRR
jgi:hypothetical protein